jgi:hypothetical protein
MMTRRNAISDVQIRHALEARAQEGIRPDVDLWPHLEDAAAEQRGAGTRYTRRQRSFGHMVLVLAVCVGSLASGAAGAGAASPPLRHFLLQAIGIPLGASGAAMDASGRPVEIQPLPPFTVYFPQTQPAELTYHTTGQLIPLGQGLEREDSSGHGPAVSCTEPPALCANNPLRALYSTLPNGRLGSPGLLESFHHRSTRVVWFGFSGADQHFIQIAEWDASASPLKGLSAASIPSAGTVLMVKKGSTTIAIATNLGPAEAQNVADSLEPLSTS